MHRLTLPANQIPVGSTVCKTKGDKQYVLASSMTVFRKRRDNNDKTRPSKIEIQCESDEVMLLADGYASIEPNDRPLVWLATPEQFSQHVHREAAQ